MGENNEVIVTLKGMKSQVSSYSRQGQIPVVEIDPELPYFIQLMDIDPKAELVIALPERLNRQRSLDFRDKIFRTNACRKLYQNTHNAYGLKWAFNALSNANTIFKGKPIDTLRKPAHAKVAIIVGNGPSIANFTEKPANAEVFACWHAVSKIQANGISPDYVMHIDVGQPQNDFIIPELPQETPIIATPTVYPSFLEQYPQNSLYTYISQEIPVHSWFAQQLGCSEHRAIDGTVIYGAICAAMYAGYQHIALIGVDLSSPHSNEYRDQNKIPLKNRFGVEINTITTFMVFKECLENLASMEKEVHLYNLSKTGIDLDGFAPLEWEKLASL